MLERIDAKQTRLALRVVTPTLRSTPFRAQGARNSLLQGVQRLRRLALWGSLSSRWTCSCEAVACMRRAQKWKPPVATERAKMKITASVEPLQRRSHERNQRQESQNPHPLQNPQRVRHPRSIVYPADSSSNGILTWPQLCVRTRNAFATRPWGGATPCTFRPNQAEPDHCGGVK